MLDAILFVNPTPCIWRRRTSLPAHQPAARGREKNNSGLHCSSRTSRLASSKICATPIKRDGRAGQEPEDEQQYRHRAMTLRLDSCRTALTGACSTASRSRGVRSSTRTRKRKRQRNQTRRKPQSNASKMCTPSSVGLAMHTINMARGRRFAKKLQQTRERYTVSASSRLRSRAGEERMPVTMTPPLSSRPHPE
jgi:hypothetical protein